MSTGRAAESTPAEVAAESAKANAFFDREFDERTERSKSKFLESQKIPLRRISGTKPDLPDKDAGLMHQKFAVIDRRNVFTGSYNWAHSAETLNDENLLYFRNAAALADEYRKIFFQLWERKS